MLNDKRLETIEKCLQYALDGNIGEIVQKGDTLKYITEIYPYNNGMFLCYTIKDSRALMFEERKLLVYISQNGYIDILGECDLRTSQCIDTCITEEFVDARYTYAVNYAKTKSLFFKKRHIKNMNKQIDFCKELARIAIEVINSREDEKAV